MNVKLAHSECEAEARLSLSIGSMCDAAAGHSDKYFSRLVTKSAWLLQKVVTKSSAGYRTSKRLWSVALSSRFFLAKNSDTRPRRYSIHAQSASYAREGASN